MKYALVINNVVDTISFEPQEAPWIKVGDDVFGGFVKSGSKWVPPEEPEAPTTYEDLFPTEFLMGMLSMGITPDMVSATIDGMQEPDRSVAQIFYTRSLSFKRENPLVDQIAGIFGKSPADVNAAWIAQQNTRT